MKILLLIVLTGCVLAVHAAPPAGTETLRAERKRVEQMRDDMEVILDSTPGGRGVAAQLDAQRRRYADRMLEDAFSGSQPAKQARDPFAVTPQLRARTGGGPGYIRPLPGMAAGELPAMTLRGLIGGVGARVALIDVREVGPVRVREGATFQVPGGMAFRVKLIRDDSVVLESGLAETEFVLVR